MRNGEISISTQNVAYDHDKKERQPSGRRYWVISIASNQRYVYPVAKSACSAVIFFSQNFVIMPYVCFNYDIFKKMLFLQGSSFVTRFDLIHKHGSTDRLPAQCVFIHGVIDVLNQPVSELDVLAADGWDRFGIHVRLLIWLVIS